MSVRSCSHWPFRHEAYSALAPAFDRCDGALLSRPSSASFWHPIPFAKLSDRLKKQKRERREKEKEEQEIKQDDDKDEG